MGTSSTYTRAEPYCSEVLERSSCGHTFTLRLSIDPNIGFLPGDSVAILPENDKERIDQICSLLGSKSPELFENTSIHHVTAKLLRFVLPYAKNPEEIQALIDGGRTTDFVIPLWEVLEACHPLSAQECAEHLSPLLPRYYSIASANSNTAIDLLVAKTESLSWRKESLTGLCTDYLERRVEVGDPSVRLYLHRADHFRLPEDPYAAVIMVGPGTGVAPFRAFLQAREEMPGENWLFFGARHEASDFYYREEFEALASSGKLILDTAFSRDSEEKVYVQHLIEKEADRLWDWLQRGAYFYICGDAKKMARDVTATLQKIAADRGAPDFFKVLRKEGRFCLDVY